MVDTGGLNPPGRYRPCRFESCLSYYYVTVNRYFMVDIKAWIRSIMVNALVLYASLSRFES